jgi:hypothetical protein
MIKRNQTQKRLHLQKNSIVLMVLIILALLSGCNFPQATPTAVPISEQKMTEVAGILNPSELLAENTTVPETITTPTLQPGEPTAPVPEQQNPPLTFLDGFIVYTTQQGDTLNAIAQRFDVDVSQMASDSLLPQEGLLPLGVQITVPDILSDLLPYHVPLLPDSEVIYGPSVGGFDAAVFAQSAGGFLAEYTEDIRGEVFAGPEIVQRVALETSTNPRLLLAFLEYRSGWVLGHPADAEDNPYPIGYGAGADTGLYNELMITAKLLAQGFYGWRDGTFTRLTFFGGGSARLSPGLNAGSVGLMHLFATLYTQPVWETHLSGAESFLSFYQTMFGDYWPRAEAVEPYLLSTAAQPTLTLPFPIGETLSLTGGPHMAWQTGTPFGALDFAPITGEPHCAVSVRWATAAAPGLVVRSIRSVVAIDLDGDGDEGTGWVLVYQHMAEEDRVALNTWLDQDAPVGHPSCEGGQASGTHLHFTRKFNGEWVGVSEPLPLVLSGWRAYAGEYRYQGYLQRGEEIVNASPNGMSGSSITRDE